IRFNKNRSTHGQWGINAYGHSHQYSIPSLEAWDKASEVVEIGSSDASAEERMSKSTELEIQLISFLSGNILIVSNSFT
ncbi:MAG: hypothetical protein M1431_00890, partial [Candidatus Thermoplasmatota archaeon]|nr:hypothetical protein [Candidatus Thermoplasmatota archaeon]